MRAILIALLLLPAFFASAQTGTLDQAIINLQKQGVENPFEKVYLHLDKSYYGAGDTIWFKGYVVTGQQHRLTGISYVLNVDLINDQNDIIRSIKLPLAYGLTRGDFALPDTLHEGSYRIRAYTNWMRNRDPEYFFDKTFTIVNAVTNKVFTHSSYSYIVNAEKQTVNAVITYTDMDGKPYVNKEVRYEVELEPEQVAKGKGTTDDKGELHITFTNPRPGILNSGQIVTTVLLDSKTAISKTIAIKAATSKVDVQFFPESGNLVNGVASKVAFKATGADGLGADIKGTIVDEQNNIITAFNNTHLGMGVFTLTPQAGKSYKANITYANGSQSSLELPKSMDKGYVVAIDNADTLNNVIVQITGAANEIQNGSLTLLAQAGGDVYFEGKSRPGKTSFTAVIPKSKFPSGIVQFTLFSDTGEPLNERMVFIQNPDKLKILANTDRQSYSPRQKVKLDFNIKDKLNQPVEGNFSVAVTDESIAPVDENSENTILSNLLLTSDIKGYVEQPNYYFAHINSKTAADLDVLMLTQGYSRFEWKQVMNNTPPVITYQPEKAITISGSVKTKGGKPIVNGKVSLMNLSQGIFLIDTVTDKNGRFSFLMAFADSNRFTIKSLNARGNDNNTVLQIDQVPGVIKKNKNAADITISLDKGLEAYLQNSKKQFDEYYKYGIGDHSIMLNEVTINTEHKSARKIAEEKAVEFSSNLNGKGEADQIITAEDLDNTAGGTLWDRLNGRLAGVEIRQDTNGNIGPYSIRSSNKLNGPPQPMQVLVNGTFGVDLDAVSVENIASIEVLRTGTLLSAYGSRGGNGIILITTKHGGQESITHTDDYTSGFINYTPKGYYKAKQFYSPRYDVGHTGKIADLRSTIFWSPLLQTDKDGNASLEFFNADGKGTYRVVIEGIDYKSGSLGRQVYQYKVE